MEAGYKIDNHSVSRFATEILVNNYHAVNQVMNLPIVNRSCVCGHYTVGYWRVKQFKKLNND